MSEQELDIDNILSDMELVENDEKQLDESVEESNKVSEEIKTEEEQQESNEQPDKLKSKRPPNDKPNNRWEQLLQERRLAREEAAKYLDQYNGAQKEISTLNTQISSLKQQITQYDEVIQQIMKQIGADGQGEVDLKSLTNMAKPVEQQKPVDPEEIRKSVLDEIKQESVIKEKVSKTASAWEPHIKRVQNEFKPDGKALFQDAFQYFSSKIDKNIGMLDTLEYVGSLEYAPETLYAIAQDKAFQSMNSPYEQIRRVNTINQQIVAKKAKVTKSESLPNGGGKASSKTANSNESFADYRKRKYGG